MEGGVLYCGAVKPAIPEAVNARGLCVRARDSVSGSLPWAGTYRRLVKERMGKQQRGCNYGKLELPAAARNLIPLSRFPQGGKPGRGRFPPRRARSAPANTAGTASCSGSPRKRGSPPLRDPPRWPHRCTASRRSVSRIRRRWAKKKEEGRQVVLDLIAFSWRP